MRVIVDQARCTGAGQCVLAAAAVFDQSEDDGTVILLDAEPPESLASAVEDAVVLCPAGAIALER